MRPLSAIDAIGPAWNHTSRLLLAPRSWRLVLKIGAVAVFAGIGGFGTGSFNSSHNSLRNMHHMHSLPFDTATLAAAMAALAALAVLLVFLFFILWAFFFYLGSRLQFVLFEIVLRRDTTVAPIWRRYGAATWHWIALRLIFVIAALLCLASLLVPAVIQFIHMLPHHGAPPPDLVTLIPAFLGIFASVFLVALIFGVMHVLLHDFGLPSMALESTPMGVTVLRVWNLLRAEPGQVLLYLIMRFLMGLAGNIAASIVIVLGALFAAIPFGCAGLILWLLLRHAGFVGHVLIGVGVVGLGLAFLVLLILVSIMLFGYLVTFLQAYALYFLGGRYPLVGVHLEPFLPPPYMPPGYPPYPVPEPPPAPAA